MKANSLNSNKILTTIFVILLILFFIIISAGIKEAVIKNRNKTLNQQEAGINSKIIKGHYKKSYHAPQWGE